MCLIRKLVSRNHPGASVFVVERTKIDLLLLFVRNVLNYSVFAWSEYDSLFCCEFVAIVKFASKVISLMSVHVVHEIIHIVVR